MKEIHEFVGTGFTIRAVKKALRASNGDKDDAIALLFDEDGSMCLYFDTKPVCLLCLFVVETWNDYYYYYIMYKRILFLYVYFLIFLINTIVISIEF